MKATQARAVLTGASGGIGRAMVRELVSAGAAVMLVGRNATALAALALELGNRFEAAPRVAWHAADITDSAAIAGLAGAAAAWNANVLINNAGIPSFGRFEAADPALMERVIQTNLLAPMRLTHALWPTLSAQPLAQVINVGSALGRLGLPGFAVYGASKFGLRGFSEALRREWAGGSVRVQYLGPRGTRTGFNDESVERYNRDTGASMDDPAVVAAALLELLESEAAECFTGFPENLAVRLNGLVPALLDRILRGNARHLPATAAPAKNSA
jgi:short-subunit dehydrogenase